MTKRVNTHASANGMTPRFLFAFASNVDSIVTESGEEKNCRPGHREWLREERKDGFQLFNFVRGGIGTGSSVDAVVLRRSRGFWRS